MSSNITPKESIYDPTAPPWTPSIYPRPRHVVVGTDEHKVRVTSTLLPDSPFASTAPLNNQVFIPRLDGSRQLYVEKKEPAWLTGAHGLSKPAKVHLPLPHWHKQHTALRAQNLTKNANRPAANGPDPASRKIDVYSEAFESDPAKLKHVPVVVLPPAPCVDAADTNWPKPMARASVLEIIEPSVPSIQTEPQEADVIHHPDVHEAVFVHHRSRSKECVCATGWYCPLHGSDGNYEEEINDEALVDLDGYVFLPCGQYYQTPTVSNFNRGETDEKETSHKGLIYRNKYVFPPQPQIGKTQQYLSSIESRES